MDHWLRFASSRTGMLDFSAVLQIPPLPATFPSILRNYLHTRERTYERIQYRADELPPLFHWALESERQYDLLFPLSAATATFDRVDRLSSLA